MSPIKNISNLPQDFRRTERSDAQKRVQDKKADEKQQTLRSEQDPQAAKDSVRLSDAAQALLKKQNEVHKYVSEIGKIDPLDQSQVHEIEEKVGSGFYASPEVLEQVAAALSKVPTIADSGVAADKLTPEHLNEIMGRIRDGEYDGDAVVNTIIERIIQDL